MKRYLMLLLSIVLIIALGACSSGKNSTGSSKSSDNNESIITYDGIRDNTYFNAEYGFKMDLPKGDWVFEDHTKISYEDYEEDDVVHNSLLFGNSEFGMFMVLREKKESKNQELWDEVYSQGEKIKINDVEFYKREEGFDGGDVALTVTYATDLKDYAIFFTFIYVKDEKDMLAQLEDSIMSIQFEK